jgi:hypothetical protein
VNSSAPFDEADQNEYDREHNQQMDEATHCEGADQPEGPQHYKYDRNRPKHACYPINLCSNKTVRMKQADAVVGTPD